MKTTRRVEDFGGREEVAYCCFQPIAAEENDAGGSAMPETAVGLENVDTAIVKCMSFFAKFSNKEVQRRKKKLEYRKTLPGNQNPGEIIS